MVISRQARLLEATCGGWRCGGPTSHNLCIPRLNAEETGFNVAGQAEPIAPLVPSLAQMKIPYAWVIVKTKARNKPRTSAAGAGALEFGHLTLHLFARGVGGGTDALDAQLEFVGIRRAQERFI